MPDSIYKAYADGEAQDRYDEMFASRGQVRPHWQTMLDALRNASPAAMHHKVRKVERDVKENGVTYNVYADPQGLDRPWDLDVVPMILPADEWAIIEAGVIQRAQLMNKLLLDVYGPQKLLADGHLPASLIHGHEGFLRPCHGIQTQDGIALHTYAVDIARSSDGQWWAVNDRTQAPSGAGYALENRLVISRTFPELFRELNVQRMANFFTALRDSLSYWGRACLLNHRAPGDHGDNSDRPLIVLLTPGPYNETFYEQSYLARYLGIALVQGGDLTVRDGFVWLKTLSGLQRVHVILRRVDDDYCDPLELRSDSALGVAGLTEAARRGTVLIANSLGSNLLESGALLGFLPKLCNELLGEPLKLPSVATWWCGEPSALEQSINRLDELVFKPSFPQLRQTPVFGEDLNPDERVRFIAKLRANPHNYVAQEQVRISQAPVWKAKTGTISPSAVGIRLFACATPNGYIVMPGGLARVATGPDARIISMQRGGSSKDTWVLANDQSNEHSFVSNVKTTQDIVRSETQLASRTVENLFWFGRYAERCDNTARLMRCTFERMLALPANDRGEQWNALIALCEIQGLLSSELVKSHDDSLIEKHLLNSLYDESSVGLSYNVRQLFRLGFNLRERLSADNWRSMNQMLQELTNSNSSISIGDAMSLFDKATVSLMTLAGFTLDGMTRDIGWRFLSIGRRIERLQYMCSAIQHALTMPADGDLEWLLELGDSIITYRSRYMARPQWLPVLDLLLLDESNPRSVLFQLDGLIKSLKRIAINHGDCGVDLIEPLLQQLLSLNSNFDLSPGNETLLALMRNIYSASYRLAEHLEATFFSYSGRIASDHLMSVSRETAMI
jgi:uncharacterized circularly permuted ATP-grasp superfamily protein/uncharacterized alpha-E superfamily protein